MTARHAPLRRFAATLVAAVFASLHTPPTPAQTLPLIVGTSGPRADAGRAWAGGFVDQLKLANVEAGPGVAPLRWTLCDAGSEAGRGLACYERLVAGRDDVAVLPLAPHPDGLALAARAAAASLPVVAVGFGRAEWADGAAFPWLFPLGGTAWVAADVFVQALADEAGGALRLAGRRVLLVLHDSPHGREPLPPLLTQAARLGFELLTLPLQGGDADAARLRAALQAVRPDQVLVWGDEALALATVQAAVATGLPASRVTLGPWLQPDDGLRALGDAARGVNALVLHGALAGTPATLRLRDTLYRRGEGSVRWEEVDRPAYAQGRLAALAVVEAIRLARAAAPSSQPLTPRQLRWGLERLQLTPARIEGLGYSDALRPWTLSCGDHGGSRHAALRRWDGRAWEAPGPWREADRARLRGLLRARATGLLPAAAAVRPVADCRP